MFSMNKCYSLKVMQRLQTHGINENIDTGSQKKCKLLPLFPNSPLKFVLHSFIHSFFILHSPFQGMVKCQGRKIHMQHRYHTLAHTNTHTTLQHIEL